MFTWKRIYPLMLAWGLAGLLAGAAFSVETVWRNDSLRDPQTILVFALWLSGLLMLFSILAGLGSLVLWWLARMLRRRPAASGMQTGACSLELGYAAAAWIVFSLEFLLLDSGWIASNPVLDESVTFRVSLILGMTAAAAARLIVARKMPAHPLRWPPVAAAVLALCVLAALVQAMWMRDDGGEESIPQQVRELTVNPEREVLLIGLDGADWRRIDALIAQGQLPAMQKMINQGVRSNLRTFSPTLSPIIWTTIATGMREDRHGIRGFTEVWLPGAARPMQGIDDPDTAPWLVQRIGRKLLRLGLLQQRPVSSSQRRTMASWNILSNLNLRVGVINWFASWPSDPVNGYFVSNNNPWHAAFLDRRIGEQISSVSGITWPPGLLGELSDLQMPDVGQSAEDVLELEIFDDLTASERQKLLSEPVLLDTARIIYLADVFAAEAGLELMKRERLNLLAVYLSGIDNLSHRLGRMTGVVDRYYRYMDEVLGRYMELAGENATIIVLSDHGWEYEDDKLRGHEHAPDGVLMMSGNGIRKGATVTRPPSVLDIEPTLLALFGLPASGKMEGAAINELLEQAVIANVPDVTVDTYGNYHAVAESTDDVQQQESNEETLEKLRTLGYIR